MDNILTVLTDIDKADSPPSFVVTLTDGSVIRCHGASAFLAYAGAAPLFSIWYHMTWSFTVKELIDGLVYALLTAGVFGWLWP